MFACVECEEGSPAVAWRIPELVFFRSCGDFWKLVGIGEILFLQIVYLDNLSIEVEIQAFFWGSFLGQVYIFVKGKCLGLAVIVDRIILGLQVLF